MKKRIFAFLIAFVLILTMSVLACAAADSTPQEDVTGTEPDIAQVGRIYPVIMAPAGDAAAAATAEDAIKALIYDENKDTIASADDVILTVDEELSNGTILFRYQLKGMTYSEVAQIEQIGDYEVTFGVGIPFYIFTADGEIVELKDAYEQGIITDEIMDELVESSVFFKKAEPATEEATEKAASTVDEATPDTASGAAIQTGATFSWIVLLLMVESIVVVIVYRRKVRQID